MAGMSIAVAILVVAGVLVYVLGNSPSGSPRARLETALIATRSATNADLTIDLKASLGGMSVDLRANGAVDLHPEP